MGFGKTVTEDALVACGRHCCVCHKFCGTKIELHHIIQTKDDGEDTFDNCIPLCFDCHADVKSYNPKHPKGKKFTESELKRHRDNWYKKVESSIGVFSSSDNYINLDRETFKRLTTLLKSDGIMLFIKQNGFTLGAFPDEIDRQVYRFIQECELPEFEFIDSDLESLKSELKELLINLDFFIGKHTFPAGPGQQAIPYEWEEEQTERYDKAHSDFDSITKLVWDKYDDLIKLARRKLFGNE